MSLKIATWNVNSLKVRLPQVLQWFFTSQADILALQEIKVTDENFPLAEIEEAGLQVVFSGQKTYNGMAIISKQQASDVIKDLPSFVDPQRRVLAATINGVRIINLYVPNGQSVDSDKYQYKLEWLEHTIEFIKQQLQLFPQLIVLGDFNIAPEDRDVYDPEAWQGHVLVSPAEREKLQRLLALGLQDIFRMFDQPEESYSWWDYRAAAFRRNMGLRIDLMLASSALSKKCQSCVIDKDVRSWERPSDHTTVVAEFSE